MTNTEMAEEPTIETAADLFEESIHDKLRILNLSKESIESTSDFLISAALPDGVTVDSVVEMWQNHLLRAHRAKKLPFVYLANDLIRNTVAKQKQGKEVNDFKSALGPPVVGKALSRLFTILKDSDTYGSGEK